MSEMATNILARIEQHLQGQQPELVAFRLALMAFVTALADMGKMRFEDMSPAQTELAKKQVGERLEVLIRDLMALSEVRRTREGQGDTGRVDDF